MSLEKILCYNYSCENILTEFELKRLSFKFTKWIFCRRCRFGRHNIELIRCKYCLKPMSHDGKIVCPECKLVKSRAVAREGGRKRKGIKVEDYRVMSQRQFSIDRRAKGTNPK